MGRPSCYFYLIFHAVKLVIDSHILFIHATSQTFLTLISCSCYSIKLSETNTQLVTSFKYQLKYIYVLLRFMYKENRI